MNFKILNAGDRAVVVEFGSVIDEQINQQVHNLSHWLEEQNIFGLIETVPTFRSLMILFEPSILSADKLKEVLLGFQNAASAQTAQAKRILKVPCCYGARFGADLHDMEKYTGLDRDEIIRIYSGVDYKIYMLGFLPGFVYLGGLDPRIEMPRLSSPRVKINPGAVGIGGNQTGVYPLASPGGWRLIGGTPLDFYDPDREQPILCKAGEYIRFVPITIDEYYDIRQLIVKGQYEPEVLEVY